MEQNDSSLRFDLDNVSSHFSKANIIISTELVDKTYTEATLAQKNSVRPYGFQTKKDIPIEYIKTNFEHNINNHMQEFLFKYFVLSFLHRELRQNKINVAGEPRLTNIEINPSSDAIFSFDLSLFPKIEFQNWKYYPFKAPKRKNYKDLDRQVEDFMRRERKKMKESPQSSIDIKDWVCFDIWVVDQKKKPTFGNHKENLWVKVGYEEADREFQNLFLGKKPGDQLYASDDCVQEYFGSQIGKNYTFGITIKDFIPHRFFCFENFKRQFRIKTKKEIRTRLIEVFSFRNDLSQRQAMVEEAFKLMLSKYKFDVPNYLVLRQQKNVLESIQKNPDYHVYKTQKDFDDQIEKLARKQIKEIILIDQLAANENMKITHEDIVSYLNLTKRARMKEFIYFKMPETKIDGQETPIASEVIKQQCLREKVLNYIIYQLTR